MLIFYYVIFISAVIVIKGNSSNFRSHTRVLKVDYYRIIMALSSMLLFLPYNDWFILLLFIGASSGFYAVTYPILEKVFLKWNVIPTKFCNRLYVEFKIPLGHNSDLYFKDYSDAEKKEKEFGYPLGYFTKWYDKLDIIPYPQATNKLVVGSDPETNYLT